MGTTTDIDLDEKDRLAALAKWAKRVVQAGDLKGMEARRSARVSMNSEIGLIPIQKESLRPNLSGRIKAVARDVSETGLGIVSNRPLDDEMYFCEVVGQPGIFLLRRARERSVRGSIREYGFMILDRYESYQQLRDT